METEKQEGNSELVNGGKTFERRLMKQTIKDSVFTNLFSDKKYLIQLYQALHPEDKTATEDDISDVTIRNILTDNMYNDLGFFVGDRLLILIEAQSTWSSNILWRALMYLMHTCREYIDRHKIDIYSSVKIKFPKPELYVIFTGERLKKPEYITLSEEFYNGQECSVDVKIKIIYDGEEGDIINQYVIFTRVCSEQAALYGRTKKAVEETIRICKDRNVLKEYLEDREAEVMDIMTILYDQEYVWKVHFDSELKRELDRIIPEVEKRAKEEAKEEAEKKAKEIKDEAERKVKEAEKKVKEEAEESARKMIKDGNLPFNKVAEYSGLPLETIEKLAKLNQE